MSQHANPASAYLWLDCDAYRAPVGTARPDLSDMTPGAEYDGWEAYGGLEVGFSVSSEGSATPKRVMNYRKAAYKVGREPKSDSVTFRSVDASKAYLDTYLQGGRILHYPDGTYELDPGTGEEFALLLIARDGQSAGGYISNRVTTSTPPTEGAVDGDTMAGSEFTLTALEPLRKIYDSGLDEVLKDSDKVVQVDATGKERTSGDSGAVSGDTSSSDTEL